MGPGGLRSSPAPCGVRAFGDAGVQRSPPHRARFAPGEMQAARGYSAGWFGFFQELLAKRGSAANGGQSAVLAVRCSGEEQPAAAPRAGERSGVVQGPAGSREKRLRAPCSPLEQSEQSHSSPPQPFVPGWWP